MERSAEKYLHCSFHLQNEQIWVYCFWLLLSSWCKQMIFIFECFMYIFFIIIILIKKNICNESNNLSLFNINFFLLFLSTKYWLILIQKFLNYFTSIKFLLFLSYFWPIFLHFSFLYSFSFFFFSFMTTKPSLSDIWLT